MMELMCIDCKRSPAEIPEYVEYGKLNGVTPDEFVLEEEGTLNPANGHFVCTECYVRRGLPSAPGGWKAP